MTTPEESASRAKTLYSTLQALASRGLIIWLVAFVSLSSVFTDTTAAESLRWIAIAAFGAVTVAVILGQKYEDASERQAKADIAVAQIEHPATTTTP